MTCFHCEELTSYLESFQIGEEEDVICFECCDTLGIKYQQKISLKEYGKSKRTKGEKTCD